MTVVDGALLFIFFGWVAYIFFCDWYDKKNDSGETPTGKRSR